METPTCDVHTSCGTIRHSMIEWMDGKRRMGQLNPTLHGTESYPQEPFQHLPGLHLGLVARVCQSQTEATVVALPRLDALHERSLGTPTRWPQSSRTRLCCVNAHVVNHAGGSEEGL
jgi:hypothetical protein